MILKPSLIIHIDSHTQNNPFPIPPFASRCLLGWAWPSPTLADHPHNFRVIDHAQTITEKNQKIYQQFYICSCRQPCHGEINSVDYSNSIFVYGPCGVWCELSCNQDEQRRMIKKEKRIVLPKKRSWNGRTRRRKIAEKKRKCQETSSDVASQNFDLCSPMLSFFYNIKYSAHTYIWRLHKINTCSTIVNS